MFETDVLEVGVCSLHQVYGVPVMQEGLNGNPQKTCSCLGNCGRDRILKVFADVIKLRILDYPSGP